MTPPSRATADEQICLDLRKRALSEGRPVDELLQFYVLECFLDRLAATSLAEHFVLKEGVLLAAFGERRPPRDITFLAQAQHNGPAAVRDAIIQITRVPLDDGLAFEHGTTKVIRISGEGVCPGMRVTMGTRLFSARPQFRVDVNVGDPITPPGNVTIPRLLGGTLVVRGYPLAVVFAELTVTAIARGTASTRWRDYADMYLLARRYPLDGTQLSQSIRDVGLHRGIKLMPLSQVLAGYGDIGQSQWAAWRRQLRENRLPMQLTDVVRAVVRFVDPAITGTAAGHSWLPEISRWMSTE
jgi:nucleotidyltransferase AbiEii toxin of type IV toxin-antitoxin system